MFGEGVVDDVVDALGRDDAVTHMVEVAIHSDDRDREALRGVERSGGCGAVGDGEDRDVRADHARLAGKRRDANETVGGEALVDFLELANLAAEGPLAGALGDENDERAAAKFFGGLGFSG